MDKKGYVKKIVNSLLLESANHQQIINAIKKHTEVKVLYDDNIEDGKGKGLRVIEPVAYGRSLAGNNIIRVFQPMGDSKTKNSGWKTLRVDRIQKWVQTPKTFEEPPGFQWNVKEKFNKEGDKDMSEIYAIANFDNSSETYNKGGLASYNKQRQEENPLRSLDNKIRRKSYKAKDFPYIQKNIDSWKKPENFDSVWDMYQAKDFGDDIETSTEGPVTKNNNNSSYQNNTQQNYNNALKNGPVKKNNNIDTEKEENE